MGNIVEETRSRRKSERERVYKGESMREKV
jgi:hypothetical protein